MSHFATLENLFSRALEQPRPSRLSFLDRECGSDLPLRRELELLLAAHDEAHSFLEQPAVVFADSGYRDSRKPDLVGARIGPYQLLEQIGEGGMGIVYMAEQSQPVRRKVALKIVKPGMDSQAVIARFEAERQALAMMDHPNIAKILDAGTVGEGEEGGRRKEEVGASLSCFIPHPSSLAFGRPYFVMELVRGIPITEYCEREEIDLEARLKLFLDVCRAVQHAHLKAVIHRDLKPGNVLVTLHDGDPVVKVIDFGVAKALNQKLTERTLFTQYSQLIGTPLYMSPEQADIGGLDIDTRADVYSLGVLLYELLTGTTPFDKQRLKQAGFDELRRIIREEEPETVSSRLAKTRSTGRLKGQPAAPRVQPAASWSPFRARQYKELDWITARCLEKSRSRRYESVSDLAADVSRFLANEPVTARPTSRLYRFGKWVHRNPTMALCGAAGALAALALALGGWYHNHHLTRANLALDAVNDNLNDANQKLSLALADARRLESEAVERERLVHLQAYAREMRSAYGAWHSEQSQEALEYLDRQLTVAGRADVRGFEWHWLKAFYPDAQHSLVGHTEPLLTADVSPDEQWIASGDKSGIIKIWHRATGAGVQTLRYADKEITAVAFSPDGRFLATAGVDRTVRLWDVGDWSEAAVFRGHELTVTSIAWSPDSKRLASAGRDHRIKIWDIDDSGQPRTLPEFRDVVRCLAWSPTGEHLAAAVRDEGLYLIDTMSWQPRPIQRHDDGLGALALAFSPSGKFLASGGYGDRFFLHDVVTSEQLADVPAPAVIGSIAFSPDERQLYVGVGSGQLLVCALSPNPRGINSSRVFQPGQGLLRAVIPSSRFLFTADEEAAVVQSHLASQLTDTLRIFRFATMCLAVSPEEDVACTLDANGAPRLVSFPRGKTLGRLKGARSGQIKGAWFFPTGQKLIVMDGATLRLFDTSTGDHLGELEPSGNALHSVAISPQGNYIAATANHKGEWKLCVWNVLTRRRVCYLSGSNNDPKLRLAFSPDEQMLAIASPDDRVGKVVLWNLATRTIIAEIDESLVEDLKFSPDSQLLALARHCDVLLWNAAARKVTTVLRGHASGITSLAFSPPGRTLATVDQEGIIRLWHIPTRQEIGILTRMALPASNLVFRSPYQLLNYADANPKKPTAPIDVILFDVGPSANASQ